MQESNNILWVCVGDKMVALVKQVVGSIPCPSGSMLVQEIEPL